jgi:hypothetical protein
MVIGGILNLEARIKCEKTKASGESFNRIYDLLANCRHSYQTP